MSDTRNLNPQNEDSCISNGFLSELYSRTNLIKLSKLLPMRPSPS